MSRSPKTALVAAGRACKRMARSTRGSTTLETIIAYGLVVFAAYMAWEWAVNGDDSILNKIMGAAGTAIGTALGALF